NIGLSNATPEQVAVLLQHLEFLSDGLSPVYNTRTISISLKEHSGATAATAQVDLEIVARPWVSTANLPNQTANLAAGANEGIPLSSLLNDAYSDGNGDSAAGIVIESVADT